MILTKILLYMQCHNSAHVIYMKCGIMKTMPAFDPVKLTSFENNDAPQI